MSVYSVSGNGVPASEFPDPSFRGAFPYANTQPAYMNDSFGRSAAITAASTYGQPNAQPAMSGPAAHSNGFFAVMGAIGATVLGAAFLIATRGRLWGKEPNLTSPSKKEPDGTSRSKNKAATTPATGTRPVKKPQAAKKSQVVKAPKIRESEEDLLEDEFIAGPPAHHDHSGAGDAAALAIFDGDGQIGNDAGHLNAGNLNTNSPDTGSLGGYLDTGDYGDYGGDMGDCGGGDGGC